MSRELLTQVEQRIAAKYCDAFREYLIHPKEEALLKAYEIGRYAIVGGIGIVRLVSIYHDTLLTVLAHTPPEESVRVADQAATFFAETVSPFEMAFRGFEEAIHSLQQLNATLEQRVSERTLELRRQEHFNQSIVATVPIALFVLDAKSRIVTINPSVERILGLSPGRTIGKPISDTLNFLGLCPACQQAIYSGEDFANLECSCSPPQPRCHAPKYLNLSLSSFTHDTDGIEQEQAQKLLSVEDVTERKRSEETIRSLLNISQRLSSRLEMEYLLGSLVEEAIALLDAESGCAGLRETRSLITGKYWRRGNPLPFRYRWLPGEGLPGWVLANKRPYLTNDAAQDPQFSQDVRQEFNVRTALCAPILSPENEVLAFVEIHNKQDPSGFTEVDQERLMAVAGTAAIALQNALAYQQLQEAERTLRESEARYRRIVDTANEGVWILDPQGHTEYANSRLAGILGYPSSEILGRPLHNFTFATDWVTAEARFINSDQASPAQFDFRFRRQDGSEAWTIVSTSPILDDRGIYTGRLCLLTDMTERYQAERALEQARQAILNSEREKKRFYSEVIRAVTQDKLRLVDSAEIPTDGQLLHTVPLRDSSDYAKLRHLIRDVGEGAGLSDAIIDDLVLAAGEAITNAIKHGINGRCEIYSTLDRIICQVKDDGPGIRPEDLPASILRAGFSTKVSLGMGYTLILELVDRVWLATDSQGTTVRIERWTQPEKHEVDPLDAVLERFNGF